MQLDAATERLSDLPTVNKSKEQSQGGLLWGNMVQCSYLQWGECVGVCGWGGGWGSGCQAMTNDVFNKPNFTADGDWRGRA